MRTKGLVNRCKTRNFLKSRYSVDTESSQPPHQRTFHEDVLISPELTLRAADVEDSYEMLPGHHLFIIVTGS